MATRAVGFTTSEQDSMSGRAHERSEHELRDRELAEWLQSGRLAASISSDLDRMVTNDPSLEFVDWSRKGIGDGEIVKLVKAVRDNNHVSWLWLFHNKITEVGAKALAEMLQRNATITRVGLGGNKISDVGVKSLALMLQRNNTITHLGLNWNNITDIGLKALASMLRINVTLTNLGINGNIISADLGKKVLRLAKINKEATSPEDARGRKYVEFGPHEKDSAVNAGREIMRMATETPNFEPVPIPLEYIEESTDNFSDERRFGEGSFSWVFVGKDMMLRQKFAVKRMKLRFHADVDHTQARRTFEREIMTLKHFRHPNIARLYAYHLDRDLRGTHCLVYELASLGSLHDLLRDREQKEKLHWTTRISIALDVAKALEYMHGGKGGQICFHRDVKSSNICLKRDHTALLIDCGIAKMSPQDDSEATMTVMESAGNGFRGTPGYICPIFGRRQKNYCSANEVFSLGIVFAELLTGLLQNEEVDGEEIDLFERYSKDGEKLDLVSAADECAGQWDADAKEKFAHVTLECIALRPRSRPRINDLVERLGNLESRARPWSLGERNRITVLSSAPLVYIDKEGTTHPISTLPNFALERDLLSRCIKESNRGIELCFDVATDDRLQAAAIKRCACLHFIGHGHPEALLFEDNSGGALWLGEEKLIDCIHEEPFAFAFISACHSLFMGEALVKAGVRHVVSCKLDDELRDDVALKFTYIFYLALAEGYTLLSSFQKGKAAVSARFHEEEVNKFVLLPTHDVDHNVPIFANADVLEWKDEVNEVFNSIPSGPQHLHGREEEEWNLLNLILSSQFVNLVGCVESERRSMATAVCHFIHERRAVILRIEAIYYLQPSGSQNDYGEQYVRHLHNCLASEGRVGALESKSDIHHISESVIRALQGTRVLVVLEILVMDSLLMEFIASILSKTSTKVLVVSHEQLDFSQGGMKAPSVFDACDGSTE